MKPVLNTLLLSLFTISSTFSQTQNDIIGEWEIRNIILPKEMIQAFPDAQKNIDAALLKTIIYLRSDGSVKWEIKKANPLFSIFNAGRWTYDESKHTVDVKEKAGQGKAGDLMKFAVKKGYETWYFIPEPEDGMAVTFEVQKIPITTRYAGIYSYGSSIKKGRVGNATIYPESDSTILFYLDLNRGAPSYNMGELYGRAAMKDNKAIFEMNTGNIDTSLKGCKFSLEFKKDSLFIRTIGIHNDCPFGGGVYADGKFVRRSKGIHLSFKDAQGREVYFNKIKPDRYNGPD